MSQSNVAGALAAAIAGRDLLQHPFYQRWQKGQLSLAELSAYAEQYQHFERVLPDVLAETAERLPDGTARHLVTANLADELHRPRPHVELFETFAAAVGARPDAAPAAATRNLVDLYRAAAHDGPGRALSVIAAYEVQAAGVAATKAAGLRQHYGLDGDSTAFWDVHAELERDHAGWTVEALDALDDPAETIEALASASAEAWWAFLDERNGLMTASPG